MNLKSDVKPEKAFYCADGSVFRNLYELSSKLKHISPETYAHHVNAYRNDFYNWIRDCYGNKSLAQRIAFSKSSQHTARILENSLETRKKKSKRSTAAKNKKGIRTSIHATVKKRKKKTVSKRNTAVAKQVRDKKHKIKKRHNKKIKSPKRFKKRKIRLHHIHKKIHRHIKRLAKKYGLM